MSIASDIRSHLTSWWSFNGSVTDEKGVNTLDANLSISGYSAGKTGDQVDQDSIGTVLLDSPITVSPTVGKVSFGGWVNYDGIATGPYIMGLARHLAAGTQEVMAIGNSTGAFQVWGWKDNGINTYIALQSGVRQTAYPVRIRVRDSIGQIAESDQIIRISESGSNPAGTYFVVTTWDDGLLSLYVDTKLVASVEVDAVYTDTIAYFQIGALGYGTTNCGLEDVFLMDNHVLTDQEHAYLYNFGNGISYATLAAAP